MAPKYIRRIRHYARRAFHRYAGDVLFVYATHLRVHGRLPDLARQRQFSDRLAYRRLYPQPFFSALTDKLAVRDFVSERIGSDILVPLYEIADDMRGFSFDTLPPSFVMKATHGSGWTRLVFDKTQEDLEGLRHLGQGWLARNFYREGRERHYNAIPPKILFEELILEEGQPARDYKILCFRRDGRLTQLVQVHSNRFSDHKVNYFTTDWQPLRIEHGQGAAPHGAIARPRDLDQLLHVADVLSRPFNHVRVDLYTTGKRIYFGELTFTPGAGLARFNPRQTEEDWARLFEPDPVYYARLSGKPGGWTDTILAPESSWSRRWHCSTPLAVLPQRLVRAYRRYGDR